MEDTVDEKYYLSDKALDYILSTGTKNFYYKPEIDLEIARPLTATMHKSHRASQDNYVSEAFVLNNEKFEVGNYLPIKEATKKGFKEAHEGDYVNLQFPNSETRRGRVGEQIANTLLCNDAQGVVVDDMRQYYISDKGVKYILDPKRGMCTDINADVAQTLTANGQNNWTGSFISPDIDTIEKSKTIGSKQATIIHLKNGETITSENDVSHLRIRKLTPKECFRLMGFDDKDCDVLTENKISNTQLYKMAGNSIVVDVLEEIFVELLNQYEDVFPMR